MKVPTGIFNMFCEHKPIYLALAILAAVGVTAGLLFAIENFKEDEEVNSSVFPLQGSVVLQGGEIPYRLQGSVSSSPVKGFGDLELAHWETYRNEEYGFEIKFAHDDPHERYNNGYINFETNIDTGNNNLLINILSYTEKSILEQQVTAAKQTFGAPVWTYPYLLDELESKLALKPGDKCKLDTYPSIFIGCDVINFNEQKALQIILNTQEDLYPNGIKQIYIMFKSGVWFEISVYYFNQADAGFLIDSVRATADQKQILEISNQILSTFRFIEPINTSDWATYANQEYGFEFKHPKDWLQSNNFLEIEGFIYFSDHGDAFPQLELDFPKGESLELIANNDIIENNCPAVEENGLKVDRILGFFASGLLYVSDHCGASTQRYKFIIYNPKKAVFIRLAYGEEPDLNVSKLKVIASTFKFLEPKK